MPTAEEFLEDRPGVGNAESFLGGTSAEAFLDAEEKNFYLRTMDTLANASGKVTEAIKAGAEGAATNFSPALTQKAVEFNKLQAAAANIAFPQYAPIIEAAKGPLIDQPEALVRQGQQDLTEQKDGQPYWKQLATDIGAGFGALPSVMLDVAAGRGIGTAAGLSEATAAKQALPLGMAFFGAGEGPMGAAKGYLAGTALHGAGEIGQGLSLVPRLATQAGVQGVTGAGINSAEAFLEGRIPSTKETVTAGATNAALALPFALAPGKMGVERPRDSGVRIDTRPAAETFLDATAEAGRQKPAANVPDFIVRAAALIGEDPNYLARNMMAESGGRNVRAKRNGSEGTTASGIFQFTDGTWRAMVGQYGRQYGLTLDGRGDATQQATAAALFTRDNRVFLRNALGREPSDGDLYMAAFLGRGGAEQFLSGMAENPNDLAINHASPAAVRANKNIFYGKGRDDQPRTLQQVYDLMAAKVQPKDGEAMAASPQAGAMSWLTPEEQARAEALRQERQVQPLALPGGQGFELVGEPRPYTLAEADSMEPMAREANTPVELPTLQDLRDLDAGRNLPEDQLIRLYQEQRQQSSEQEYGAKGLSPLWSFLRGRVDAKSISDHFGSAVLEDLRGKAPRDLFRSRSNGGTGWDRLEQEAKSSGLVAPDGDLLQTLLSNVTTCEQAQRDRINGVNEVWRHDDTPFGNDKPFPEESSLVPINSDGTPLIDVRFHLNDRPAEAYRGIAPEDVTAGIKGYVEAAPGAAPVRIVRTQAELPPHLLEEYRQSGQRGGIEGVYDRNSRTVWLVADNLESRARAGEIWLHENVAHHGLRAVFGSDPAFDKFLARSAKFYKFSDAIGMEEHIARLAEKMRVGEVLSTPEKHFWGKLIDYVRTWLVKHGWTKPTTARLNALLQDSLTRMTRGSGEAPAGVGRMEPARAAFSAKGENPYETGPIFTGYEGHSREAIERLLKEKRGVAVGALDVPGLGPVDLMWGKTGKDGWGLAHIIERRDAEGLDGVDFSRKLPEILSQGELRTREKMPGRVYIETPDRTAIVRLDWNGESKRWLLTAYQNEKSGSLAPGGRRTEPRASGTGQTPPAHEGVDSQNIIPSGIPGKPGDDGSRFSVAGQPGDYQRDRIAFDGRDKEPLGDRARALGREAYRRMVNKDQPLTDLARQGDSVAADAIENQVRRLRGLGGIVEEMLTGKGVLGYGIDGQETTYVPGTRSLKAILTPLKTQEQYRDYESLRVAERERALAIHRPELRGNDRARAEFEIRRLERKYGPDGMARLRQVSAEHRQFERDAILTPLHDAGWLSDEAYRAIQNAPESQYYASFAREMDDVERQTVGSRDVVRTIKGSERRVLPSVEGTIANLARAVKLVETLKLHQQIVGLRDLTPDLAEAIKPWKRGGLPPRDALVTAQNGQKTYWKAPPDVAKALSYFNPREVNVIVKALSYPAKWLRAGATLGLEFIARNPVRDQISAFVFSKAGGNSLFGYNPFTDFVRGVFHTIKGEWGGGDDLYSEWRAAGGAESFFTSLDRDAVRVTAKDLVAYRTGRDAWGKIVKNPLDALRAVSEFMEKGTRVGAYAKAKMKGATPLEAMAESRDLTLDFSRMGSDTRVLNQLVAFWNANVQGVDKLARAIKERPGTTLLRIGLGITLPSLTLSMMNQGQQWYEELPTWQRDYFWCFKVGDTILRVPKPFELGILFGSLPERIVDFAHKQDPQGLKDVGRAAWDALVPGWMPTAAAPLVETLANHSFFRGKPLENQAVQSLPPGMRAYSGTSEIAKRVGKLTDISPIKLENWFRSWTGSMGKLALDASSLALRDHSIPPVARTAADIPLVRGFVAREPIGSGSESVDRFYDALGEAGQAQQGRKTLIAAGNPGEARQYDRNAYFAPAARALSSKMADMRAEIAGIQQAPDISSEDKRTRIDAINRQITAAAREFDEAYRTGNLTPEILFLGERSRVKEALDQHKELVKAGRIDEARALVKSAGLDTQAGLVKWVGAALAKANKIRKAVEEAGAKLTPAQREAYTTQADNLTKTALGEFQKRAGGATYAR